MFFAPVDAVDDHFLQGGAVAPADGQDDDDEESRGDIAPARHRENAGADETADENAPGPAQSRRGDKIFPADIDKPRYVTEDIIGEEVGEELEL